MWFLYALITTLCWGAADLFYKSASDEGDKYSHLKTSMIVGIFMGIHAAFTLIFKDIGYNAINILIYLPVSAMYILSMTVGYFGLKYLELSVSSPVQNSSGVVAGIISFFILGQTPDKISVAGIIFICAGIISLGIVEKRIQNDLTLSDRKYKIGFKAFFIPIIYCIIDSLGTFLDGYYLSNAAKTPLMFVSEKTFEDVANISYEFTFLLVAAVIFVYLKFVRKEKVFSKSKSTPGCFAALFETIGQASYVYAISGGNTVVAAPMIGAYCIFSVILSRIFLKEKLTLAQYITVAVVCIGIILLGISEGLTS